MDNTKKLNLKLPASTDYVDIEVLNENFRKIDASASSLEVTLRIEADETTVVAVSHSSGTYSGISTQHTEDGTSVTRTYAEFKLPCGGDAMFMYTVGGKNFCDSACLMNGAVEWIMCGHTTIHHSILAKVPDNHFKSNASVQVADDAGVIQTIFIREGVIGLEAGAPLCGVVQPKAILVQLRREFMVDIRR